MTDLMRLQSAGAVPGNNMISDMIYWLIGGVSDAYSFPSNGPRTDTSPWHGCLWFNPVSVDSSAGLANTRQIGIPIWRMITDSQVRGARREVEADLTARGFYVTPDDKN